MGEEWARQKKTHKFKCLTRLKLLTVRFCSGGHRFGLNKDNEIALKITGVNAKAGSDRLLSG